MAQTENRVIVTPEIAKQWLETSKGNRHVSRGQVEKIKADIVAGGWRYNGDRIRFIPDGSLYDGHHRLTACAESGMSIVTDTFVMDDETAKPTIDKGRARSTADLMAMEMGVSPKKSASIAAAVRIMTVHDNTMGSDWGRGGSIGGSYAAKHLTEQALQSYYLENRGSIDEACEWAHNVIKKQNTLISKSQAIAFICLAQRAYEKKCCYDYITSVMTGYGVHPGTTADHIRSALVACKMGQRKMPASHKLYSVVKGFKSIMAGRNIKHSGNATFRPSVDAIPRIGG